MEKTTNNLIVKTPYQIDKESREDNIVNRWNELLKQPGAMITAVDKIVMAEFELYGTSTLWNIRRRVGLRRGTWIEKKPRNKQLKQLAQ